MKKRYVYEPIDQEWKNEWDKTTAELRNSGYDLSRIYISREPDYKPKTN